MDTATGEPELTDSSDYPEPDMKHHRSRRSRIFGLSHRTTKNDETERRPTCQAGRRLYSFTGSFNHAAK